MSDHFQTSLWEPDWDGNFNFEPDEQQENLDRVESRIGGSILRYFEEHGLGYEFHVEELRQWVRAETGVLAPASADRVLRDLRQKGKLAYLVVNRRQSLYRIVTEAELTALYMSEVGAEDVEEWQ